MDPLQPGAAWGDVATLTPWVLYRRFGDLELLRRHYRTGRAWVDLVERLAGPDRLWDTGFQLGDWLDPAAPPEDPAAGRTDRYLVATAYFAHSARHLAHAARALGHTADAVRYDTLADEITAAFQSRYVHADGRMSSDSPTAYALALAFDLLDASRRQAAGDRLAELVLLDDARVATGFVGTPSSATRSRTPATSTPPTGCSCRPTAPRGSTPSPWAPPPSGNAGTASAPTEPSTPEA